MSNLTALEPRVFKLSNGQLVDTEYLEKGICKICHYVQHVVIVLKDDHKLVAIIFPNRKLFSNPDYERTPEEGCFCPRNLKELGKCLAGCMHTLNQKLLPGYAKIDSAVIINSELSVEDKTLTPLLETIPENIIKKYKAYVDDMFEKKIPISEEVFYVKINNE